jgi:hypothetical protein
MTNKVNFWEILNGQRSDATPEEISAIHVELESTLTDLQAQHAAAYDELVQLQMQSLSGVEGITKKLSAAKDMLFDLQVKMDASVSALQGLREKLTEKIRTDSERRLSEQIPKERETLSEERADVYREFLTAIARAIALEEQIEGPPAGRLSPHTNTVFGGSPELRFDSRFLKGDDRAFLYSEVEKHRLERGEHFVDINRRQSALSRETDQLRELLDKGVGSETERLLKAAGSRFFDMPQPEARKYLEHPCQMSPIVKWAVPRQ